MSSGPLTEPKSADYPPPTGYDFRRGYPEDIGQARSARLRVWKQWLLGFSVVWGLWGLRQAIATGVIRWQRYNNAYAYENGEWLSFPDAATWAGLLWRGFFQFLPYLIGPLLLLAILQLLLRRITPVKERLWIARKNGRVAGWVSLINRANYADVAQLKILPQHQAQGVGSYLLWRSLQDVEPPIYLLCRPNLVSFYERFGFGPLASSAMPHGSSDPLQGMGLFQPPQIPPGVHDAKPSEIVRAIGDFDEWVATYRQLWRRQRFRDSRGVWLEQLSVVGLGTVAIALLLPKLFSAVGLHWIPLFRIYGFGLTISGLVLACGLGVILAAILKNFRGWQEWLLLEQDQIASYIHWVDRENYSLLYALQGETQYAQQPIRERLLQRVSKQMPLPLYCQVAPNQEAFYRHLGFRRASPGEVSQLGLLSWRGFSLVPEGLRLAIARLRGTHDSKLILRFDAAAAEALQAQTFTTNDAPTTQPRSPAKTTTVASSPVQSQRQRRLAWLIVGIVALAFVFSPLFQPSSITEVRAEAEQTARSETADARAIRQQQIMPLGHQGYIAAASFANQGKTLAIANWDNGNLEIWDMPGDRLRNRIETNATGFTAMQLTEEGNMLMAATKDGAVMVYDIASRKQQSHQKTNTRIQDLAIAPDQKSFITGDEDGHLQRWSRRGRRLGRVELAHRSGIGSIRVSPTGNIVATTGASDSSVKLWKLSRKSLTPRDTIPSIETGKPVEAIAFSPDGSSLISASKDGTIQRWNLSNGQSQSSFSANRNLTGMRLSSDGRMLLTGTYLRQSLYAWDPNTGQQLRGWGGDRLNLHQISPDGQRAIAGEYEIKQINLVADTPNTRLGGDWTIDDLALAQERQKLITANGDQTLRIWDLEKKQYLRSIPTGASEIRAIAAHPNVPSIVIGKKNGTVQLWNDETGKAARFAGKHQGEVTAIALSPDGRLAFSVAQDEPLVRLWDLKTQRQLDGFKTNSSTLYDLALSPNGKMLYVAGIKTVEVWDVASKQRTKTIPSHNREVEALAISPNGKFLVTGGTDRIDQSDIWVIKVWDLATGQRIKSLKGYSTFLKGMAVARDNETVVFETCCSITTWNWNSGDKHSFGEELRHEFALSSTDQLVGVGSDRETIMVTKLEK